MNDKLVKIQQELKAPKSQFNSFGKYKYRNCEDILEALKPLLNELHLSIILTDEVVNIGGRNYVKATATIKQGDTLSDSLDSLSASSYAREAVDKKGMDDAQITGSASSYARKYALNGLFAIDDTKDADSHDNTDFPPKKVESLATVKANLTRAFKHFERTTPEQMKDAIEKVLGKTTVDTIQEADEVLQALEDGLI